MKRIVALLLALGLTLLTPIAGAQITAAQKEEADAYFKRIYERTGTFNGGVLVSQKGERIYTFLYGYEDRQRTVPVTEDTVFRVASVTKLISAVGVMQLVDQGKIGLDEPLVGETGAPIRNPAYPNKDITLRQVMSHTSSIDGNAPYGGAPKWESIKWTPNQYFNGFEPGTHYEYANLNGGMLGSVMERLSGQNVNDYMAEHVFGPLGINASYAAHLLPDTSRLTGAGNEQGDIGPVASKLISQDEERFDPSWSPFSHYNLTVGRLYISLAGLEKIGTALAGDGTVDGFRLLSEEAVRTMRLDQSTVPGSSVKGSSYYGLNTYRHVTGDGVAWYGHQGRMEGILADLFYEPESGTVIVFITNGSSPGPSVHELATRMENVMLLVDQWLK